MPRVHVCTGVCVHPGVCVCVSRVCLCLEGVHPGECVSRVCLCLEGVHPGECVSRGVFRGRVQEMYTPRPRGTPSGSRGTPSLWTEGMTHACENITFPQLLLRAVKSPK